MPTITEDISFRVISSPLGNSPFDKALCNRDKILMGYIKKINRLVVDVAPHQSVLLSDSFGNEVLANCAAIFPGMGGFASGGGPLA